MIGSVIISHGKMAEGIRDSVSMFYGEKVEQLEVLELAPDMSAEEFSRLLSEAIRRTDSGDGVLVFADLYGGTPCNQMLKFLREDVVLITGMNLPVILEFLGDRARIPTIFQLDVDALIQIGREGLKRAELPKATEDEDESL